MVDIPLGLRQALESGDCVLFMGAGIGGTPQHELDIVRQRAVNTGKQVSEVLWFWHLGSFLLEVRSEKGEG